MNQPDAASNAAHRGPARGGQLLAEAGLLYAAAIWGSTFYIVKDTLAHIHPVALVGWRFTLAAALLAAWIVARARPGGRRAALLSGWRGGLTLGIILWILYIAQTIGLGITTASNSGFITGLFIVFTPLLSWALFRQRLRAPQLLAVAIATAGLWLLTGGLTPAAPGGGINAGDVLTLAAAVTYALHVIYAGRYMAEGLDPLALACQQSVVIGALSLLCAPLFHVPLGLRSAEAIWPVLFLALFPTLSAFVVQLWAQRVVSSLRTTLIFTLEPVFAALFAWTLGGEPLIALRAIGGALILAAMLVSEMGGKAR